MKRVFLIVLDSLGVGYEPDAGDFGDVGANTLKRISGSDKFDIPNLISAGIGRMDGVDYLPTPDDGGYAAVGRLREMSRGKDTTVGHWEIAGIVSERPFPTYPHGFPESLLEEFSRECGRGVLCNLPYSGTDVIRDYGEEHMRTGKLIVYTSADSVFQIAAHEELVPPEELYNYCRIARRLLTGENAVGRVIARPFIGTPGNFTRTANRHDFSLEPTGVTMLDSVKAAGGDVIAVGKITDIYAGKGITRSIFTHSNAEGMEVTLSLLDEDFHGLAFTNLVDFDMLYGHRQDVDGYAAALTRFDTWLPYFRAGMRPDDALIICADHGCDPGDDSTDHTREYIPMIAMGERIRAVNIGTRTGFSDIGATVCELLGVPYLPVPGCSFARLILK